MGFSILPTFLSRRFCALVATMFVCVAAVGLISCAPSPQNCSFNQTAVGAGVGAVGGAALGAALSHGNGGAALGGAAAGALIGGIIGNEGDRACRQYAMQKAFDAAQQRAMAEQQAMIAEQQEQEARAEAARAKAQARRDAQRRAQIARQKREEAEQQAQSQAPYQSVQWTNPSSGNHGTITPLNSYTNPATNQLCMNYNASDSLDGKTSTGGGKVCKQSDGTWAPAQ